jgi:prevent-host-death family protein
MSVIKIDEMKDQIEELVTRVQAGETILIEKNGETVARLAPPDLLRSTAGQKRKIDLTILQEFTRSLPPATESAADLVRRMRDESY